MAGEPVAERSGHAKLCRVDRCFGNGVADLVTGSRMAHQITELVVPVALLEVGDRSDRPLHMQPVRRKGSVLPALEYQALFAVDIGGRVENLVRVPSVEADELRGVRLKLRGGGLRLTGGLGLERVELFAELAVLLFEPVHPLDQAFHRIGARIDRRQGREHRECKARQNGSHPCAGRTHGRRLGSARLGSARLGSARLELGK
ncbi:MAG: hypothetical protein OXI15_01605 [Chromatiales bacterium]|nr:hypothetical protein [Chromatiales bacterium]